MLISFLIVPTFILMPILVTQCFGGSAMQLGWLNSAWGVGSVSGDLLLSLWGGFRRQIVTVLVGALGIRVSFFLVGLTPAHALPLALI